MTNKKLVFILCSCAVFLTLGGCGVTFKERLEKANNISRQANWNTTLIPTGLFDLALFSPGLLSPHGHLVVYIEGDGFAWATRRKPSSNPTPRNPLGLELALRHPQPNAVYLGRPCQYVSGSHFKNCTTTYWTDGRFGKEVIASYQEAFQFLKQRYNVQNFSVVGFSGGAAIALLLAEQRHDIKKVITVAGNLDHHAWTTYHRISPLSRSLNPFEHTDTLAHIEQVHLSGQDDRTIPLELTRQIFRNVPQHANMYFAVLKGFSHHCCWVEHWTKLWSFAAQERHLSKPEFKILMAN